MQTQLCDHDHNDIGYASFGTGTFMRAQVVSPEKGAHSAIAAERYSVTVQSTEHTAQKDTHPQQLPSPGYLY